MQRVFILGNPRSGTSLLRLMLNAHTSIASPPECGFMQWWLGKYESWGAADSANRDKVNEFLSDILTSKKIETWGLDRHQLLLHVIATQPGSYCELTSSIYAFWARMNGRVVSTIGDKNNYYIHHLRDLLKIWPDAKFLFLIRDGRDVACSYRGLQNLESTSPYRPVLPTEILDIATEWERNNSRIVDFLKSLSNDRWKMVRYESLVTDPQAELMSITSFLKTGFEPGMLEYFRRNDEPLSTLDWKKKTLERPDPENIGKYKALLSNDEIGEFEAIAGGMLLMGGYDREG